MRYHPPIPLGRIRDLGLLRRFVKKIQVDEATECWMWTGSKWNGYPRLWWRGKNMLAHRLSYSFFAGDIPDGMTVDHTCHCSSCVNPKHMTLLTASENSIERHARNRN